MKTASRKVRWDMGGRQTRGSMARWVGAARLGVILSEVEIRMVWGPA